jgi:hypothetical protein
MIINLPKLGDVEFPDNVTPEQLNGLLGKLSEKYDFTLPKPQASLGTIAKRGFMRSMGETGIALGDLAPAMLNEFIGGNKEYTERQMGEAQASREELQRKYPTRFKSYKNIDSPFEAIEYGAETLGELVPSAATIMIPGAGAGIVGGRIAAGNVMRSALQAGPLSRAGMMTAQTAAKEAGQVAGRRAMYAGNYMGSFAQNAPEVFEGIYQETGKFEPGIAALAGGISSVLDSIVPTKVMDQLGTYGKLKLVEKLAKESGAAPNVWKRIGMDAVKTAATEGLTESAQESIGAYAEQVAGSTKGILDPENIQRYKEAFVKGAVGGSAFAVPQAVSQYRTIKRDQFATKEAQQALAQQDQLARQQAQEPTAMQQQVMSTVQTQATPRTQEELEQAFKYTQEELDILQKRMDESRPGSQAYAELDAAIKAKQAEADKISQEKAKTSVFAAAKPNEQGLYPAQQPIDVNTVKSLGVNPTSKAAQSLMGLDLNTPEGVTTFVQTLEDPGYKGSINEAAYNSLVSTFDPATVATARESLKGAPNVAGPNAPTGGTSTKVASQPSGGQPTAGATTSKRDGMVSTGQNVDNTVGGEGQPTTPVATFQTSKGSTYIVGTDGKTSRTKLSPGKGQGETYEPHTALFVNPGDHTEILSDMQGGMGDHSVRLGYMANGKFVQIQSISEIPDGAEPKVGVFNKKTGATVGMYGAATAPAMGLHPVEKLYKTDGTASTHVGNSITKIDKAVAEESQELDPLFEYAVSLIQTGVEPTPSALAKELDIDQERALEILAQMDSEGMFDEIAKQNAIEEGNAVEVGKRKPPPKQPPVGTVKTINIPQEEVVTEVDKTNASDKEKVKALADSKSKTPKEKDARAYFGRLELGLALRTIANDLVLQPTRYRNSLMTSLKDSPEGAEPLFKDEAEAKLHRGQGGVHARNASEWVRENLSPKNVAYMDKWVAQYTKEDQRAQRFSKKFEKQQEQRANVETQVKEESQAAKKQGEYVPTAEEAAEAAATETLVEKGKKNLQTLAYELENDLYGSDEDLLASKDIAALFNQAHPVVLDLLARGQLTRALQSLSDTASSEFVRRTAETLSKVTGTTKLVYDAKESKFDPATNTVYLRKDATDYEILHEMSHAGLSHIISNPSHPVTKQLGQIFAQIKDDIDGAYGAKNLQEFVAEAWSNEDFRGHLKEKYAPGNKLSVWDKIMNVLRRMIGYPPKTQESVLDSVDRMLNQIASVAPDMRKGDSLYAQAMQHPNLAQKVMGKVDDVIQQQQVMTPERAAEWVGKAENMGISFRSAMQRFLNLSALGQVGSNYVGRDAITFSDKVNEMAGYYENLMNKLKPLVDREEAFARTDRYQFWSTLVNDSTVEDVNPAAPRKNYEGSPEKLAAWDQLNKRYITLTDTEKKLYNDHFSAFKEMFKELKASIRGSLNQTFRNEDGSPDDARISSAYEKIMDKITKMGIDHYSPLYRHGTFWLVYTDKDTNQSVSKLFESQAERRLEREKLDAEGHTGFDEPVRMDQMKSKSVPRGTVAADIVKIMKDGNADEKAIDAFYQLIISALPETSVLKSFQKRKNTPGYIDDAALAFTNVTSNMARQLSRMKYNEELKGLVDKMRATVGESRGKDALRGAEVVRELEARREFAMNPTLSDISRYASAGAFYFNLAGNISSAVVNLVQTPMATYPQLGGVYGYGAAGKALIAATKLYGSSGLTRVVTDINGQQSTEKAMLSIENLVNAGKAPQYKELVKRLNELGFLQNTTMREALEASNRGEISKGKSSDLMEQVTQKATFLFHHAERMNREVSAVATYDLEMQKLKNNNKLSEAEKQAQAIEKAVRMLEFTHGASHTESAPSIGHSDIGKILTVFKRFGFTMYYMLFDTIRRSLPIAGATGKELEGIQAARRQLIGTYGMAGIFAGAKGLPLYWVAELAYNALNDDDEDDFDAVMRKYLGELVYKGPVNYFTNLGIADRVGWTDLIYREAKSDKADASALSQFVESVLGAPYSVINSFFRAKELASEGHTERAIEAALPIGLRNILKGGRYAIEGANTLRGDPVMGEINGYNAAMQVMGFAPADLMAQYEENAYAKKKGDTISNMEKRYLKQYYVADRMGDYERADELRQKLYDLSDKYPELNFTEATITKSVKNRDRISEDMYHGVQLNKKLRPVIERDIAELRD